ncbi:MAG: NAD-dependent epimerase/dehydratase family protein, partial [Bacteroidota bacterium]
MGSTNSTVLITGGSGLVGRALTRTLLERGYAVRWLVRDPSRASVHGVKTYRWNIGEGYIDPAALEGTDAVIHLAGENIGGGRWTEQRKKLLMESRTRSTALLAETLKQKPNQVRTLLSASAIGYYGDRPADELLTETSTAGADFLAQITKEWEAATTAIASSGRRVVTVRIGI